ncbi:MAG TPA: hypothetical protein VGN80_08610 [Devosiaceae bacterium]|jgi:hypothetical protein|nr:hypothetical protein [Devosiaceae bacterium]
MRTLLLSLAAASCLSVSTALAGSMPELPELPPLPTDYVPVSDYDLGTGLGGSYAGIVVGGHWDPELHGALGVVLGHNFGDQLLYGIEAMALATTAGMASAEAAARVGVEFSDGIGVFGSLGLGISSHTGPFVTTGAAVEMSIGQGWDLRAQYRYAHDLSGDPHAHLLLAGMITRF